MGVRHVETHRPRARWRDQLGPSVFVGDELPLPGIAAQEARQLQPRQCPADDESLLVGLEMEPRFARHFFGTQQPSIAVQPCPHRRVILADGEHVDDTLRVGIDHAARSALVERGLRRDSP